MHTFSPRTFLAAIAFGSVAIADSSTPPAAGSSQANSYSTSDAVQYCVPQPISTEDQRQLFHAFVRDIYINVNLTTIPTYYAADYIQHNPFLPQGPQILTTILGMNAEKNQNIVARTAFDNGLGWAHVVLAPKDGSQKTMAVDIFRWNGTCIQEHWDLFMAVPANATNPLTMWGDGY